ncbi:hypothetical protein ACFQW6_06960 [Nocardioides sp. GCM10028917]|uniref:hypothetical protein n=1 Tax=Nocardioides sp. GCM10028917 TaxID=3273408 RepID=UPI003613CBF7
MTRAYVRVREGTTSYATLTCWQARGCDSQGRRLWVKPPSDLGRPWGARRRVGAHSEEVSSQPSTRRGTAADAAATLAVLVVGASLLAMIAPLTSALAVVLAALLYIPVRLRAV